MKKIVIESDLNTRLDRYIRRIYPGITQGLIERHLKKGNIRVNNIKTKSNYRVKKDDEITYFENIFQSATANIKIFSNNCLILAKKLLNEYLILATKEFIAIDKPADIAVQGGSKISLSIDEALSYLNAVNNTNFKLVHRIDKDTSGILLIAQGSENAARLTKAFSDKILHKTYYAITCGLPPKSNGTIINYIGKDKSGIFEIVKEILGGKRAETKYELLKEKKSYSLIKFTPKTGRMHQLRVHSKILGCPILGDKKYGGENYNRMMLHAQQLVIPTSVFGQEIVIESKLPALWNDFF